MVDERLPLEAEHLTGVPLPLGKAKRLIVIDRTEIATQLWPQFNTGDLFIGAGTPIVYTMTFTNLARLHESLDAALAELRWHQGRN